jgi:hypothetical protein
MFELISIILVAWLAITLPNDIVEQKDGAPPPCGTPEHPLECPKDPPHSGGGGGGGW